MTDNERRPDERLALRSLVDLSNLRMNENERRAVNEWWKINYLSFGRMNENESLLFRNQYDSDVTVWSPQGRLHQVEYAMEAVKLGSATVGLKNSTHAVIIALKRASSELSAHQKKIIPIDTHMGITISGLTADARMLSRYMRTECLNHKYSHDALLPVSRLIANLGNKMQVCTQRYDRRPYGVGLLVAGYD
ncbi:unnamed protein product, partial [Timema podura]|nr:unnamed protein product [Timema podura]